MACQKRLSEVSYNTERPVCMDLCCVGGVAIRMIDVVGQILIRYLGKMFVLSGVVTLLTRWAFVQFLASYFLLLLEFVEKQRHIASMSHQWQVRGHLQNPSFLGTKLLAIEANQILEKHISIGSLYMRVIKQILSPNCAPMI